MKLGLISDTHGDLTRTRQAIEVFRNAGVEAVIHAGDVCGSDILDELEALGRPVHAVTGNMDGTGELPLYLSVEFAGKKIAITHGHDAIRLRRAIRDGAHDYVITGHTHQRRDERVGKTRVINPGAVYRADPPSVAVLDLARDRLEYFEL